MSMTMDVPMRDEPSIELATTPVITPPRAASSPEYLMPDLCIETPSYRWTWLAAALVIVALYGVLVFRFFAAGDGGVDQNAYLVGGRLLASHFSMRYALPNPYSFTGGMFVRMPDVSNIYYPKYPFGLPLLYASFFWVFKLAAAIPFLKQHVDPSQAAYWAFIVSPASAVIAVAGMFFLARQVSGSFAAALAAILLGTSQLMLMLADNPNSHASCLAFIVWGMFFLIRWMQTGSLWRGIAGGLLVGYAATIRYSEILLFVAMCVAVLSRLPWNQWKSWRSLLTVSTLALGIELIALQVQNTNAAADGLATKWPVDDIHINLAVIGVSLAVAIAGLVISILKLDRADWMMYLRAVAPGLAWAVPVTTLLLVNHHTMGSFTGYDSTHESEFGAAFQWRFFWQNWEKVIRVFYDLGLFFVVPFAVAGLFMMFRRSWRVSLLMLAWLVPGVLLYMAYYWSPDFADAYARFFLTYLPALLVGVAVCFHDGLLGGGRDSRRPGGIALTLAAGVVVAMASGISVYRSVHGLRDGSDSTKIPLADLRERLSMAQTGQILLANVPEKSVLFAEDAGGVNTPINYVQFLRDWELYSADVFSLEGSRRGFGGGGNRRNGARNVNNNGRGGRGGGGNGGPPGGGMGGPGMGGPPGVGGGGMNGGGNNANVVNDPTAVTATPVQPEQQEYHASLYKNKSARQLYQLEADVIHKAFSDGRRVFVLVAKDHPTPAVAASRRGAFGGIFGNGNDDSEDSTDAISTFKSNLNETGKYNYKVISRWQDVSLPPEKEGDFTLTDNSPMGGGRGGAGMVGRMFMAKNNIMDWQLVEITPPAVKTVNTAIN